MGDMGKKCHLFYGCAIIVPDEVAGCGVNAGNVTLIAEKEKRGARICASPFLYSLYIVPKKDFILLRAVRDRR